MKKVFNKVIAVAATVPLALTQGFAVLSNAADATTISVERVLEIKPQELESDWAKLVEGALIDSEGKSFELNVADIIDPADFSDKNAAYDKQIAALTQQIDEQNKRKEELQTRSIYVTTKQFIEEFAREKLGLVYEDELIFRANDNSGK